MGKKTGVIRLNPELWEKLTFLAVKCSVELATPVNQSQVLHAVMVDSFGDLKVSEIVGMVRERVTS